MNCVGGVGGGGERSCLTGIERRGEIVLWCSLYILNLTLKDKTVVIASGNRLNTSLMLSVVEPDMVILKWLYFFHTVSINQSDLSHF